MPLCVPSTHPVRIRQCRSRPDPTAEEDGGGPTDTSRTNDRTLIQAGPLRVSAAITRENADRADEEVRDMARITPLLLGIGGDSGTGKSTLVGGMYKIFGPDKITNINLDDYHTFDRAQRKIYKLTALHPAANNMALMGKHAWQLKNGEKIVKPVYDHSTGTFAEPEEVEPKPIVIIGGLFPFFTQELRDVFDLKVYLDPDEELKRSWKIQRDAGKRGYTIEQVMKEIEARQEDIRKHIEPQKEYADIIIRFYAPNGPGQPQDNAHLNVRLFLSRTLPKTGLDELLKEAMGRKTRRAGRLVDGH